MQDSRIRSGKGDKESQRLHLELTVMIGASTLAEADPGGHEKEKRGKE
jgi:hypothetical protein